LEENDILDMLESDDKPFVEQRAKENEEPQSSGKKINFWEETDIPKIKIDPSTIHRVDKSYAILLNIGNVNVPENIQEKIKELVQALSTKGYIFRYSGDTIPFLMKIATSDSTIMDMYVPWKKFNKELPNVTPKLHKMSDKAYGIAAYYHKGFAKLPNGVRAILARDVHILLGEDCKRAVSFMITYTEDGCESKDKIDYKTTGTVSFGITIASEANIPIFNLKNDDAISRLIEYIKTI